MKTFETPVVNVLKFEVKDIIATSLGENELPGDREEE